MDAGETITMFVSNGLAAASFLRRRSGAGSW